MKVPVTEDRINKGALPWHGLSTRIFYYVFPVYLPLLEINVREEINFVINEYVSQDKFW